MYPKHSVMQAVIEGASGGAAPASPEPPASELQDVNWEEMSADDSLTSSPEPEPAAVVTPAAPAAATPAATTPPVPPVAAAPAAVQVPPVTPPVTPATPPVQPADPAAAAQAAAVAFETELTNVYAGELTDEVKQKLMLSPDEVLPALMAKAALDGARIAMRQMQTVLPQMVHQTTDARQGQKAAWTEFETAHPDLAKPEYRPAVVASIQAAKAMKLQPANPQEAMAAVARMTRAALGLSDPAGPAPVVAPGAAPVAPHSPVARGSTKPAAPAKPNDNPWIELLD